jgi:hypothetical protein
MEDNLNPFGAFSNQTGQAWLGGADTWNEAIKHGQTKFSFQKFSVDTFLSNRNLEQDFKFDGYIFTDEGISFSACTSSKPVVFKNCIFNGGMVRFDSAMFDAGVVFENCEFKNSDIVFSGASISSEIIFRDSRFFSSKLILSNFKIDDALLLLIERNTFDCNSLVIIQEIKSKSFEGVVINSKNVSPEVEVSSEIKISNNVILSESILINLLHESFKKLVVFNNEFGRTVFYISDVTIRGGNVSISDNYLKNGDLILLTLTLIDCSTFIIRNLGVRKLGVSNCDLNISAFSISMIRVEKSFSWLINKTTSKNFQFKDFDIRSGDFSIEGSTFSCSMLKFKKIHINGDIFKILRNEFNLGGLPLNSCKVNVKELDCSHNSINGDFTITCSEFKCVNGLFNHGKYNGVNIIETFIAMDEMNFSSSNVGEGGFEIGSTNRLKLKAFKFDRSRVSGRFSINSKALMPGLETIDMYLSEFDSPVNISGIEYGGIPNLRFARFSKEVDISKSRINPRYRRKLIHLFFSTPIDEEADLKMMRLKEISEESKHYDDTLFYHGHELKSKRWKDKDIFRNLFDYGYSAISGYGQSLLKPIIAYIVNILFFWAVYNEFISGKIVETFSFSLLNSLSLLTINKAAQQSFIKLAGASGQSLHYLFLVIGAQGVISIAILFLLGLGIRNRFRIK